ncbi:MAG TPA: ABC transporter permease [Thermotogota bacterium]|nr:ABC transporter permease [Thermotogota bacterium]
MGKFIHALKIDMTVAMRNGIVLITAIVAVAYILMVNFVIPEELNSPFAGQVILDESTGAKYSAIFTTMESGALVYTSRADFDKEMDKGTALGLIIDDNGFTVIQQGYEGTETVNSARAAMQFFLDSLKGQDDLERIEVQSLNEYPADLNLKERMVPMLLASDVILLGFLFGTTMIFQERKERSITAYRVSPAGAMTYLMSKATLNVMMALVFTLAFCLFTIGFGINYVALLLLICVVAFLITFIGILLGQFFSSLSDFMYIMLGFMLIMSLPVFTYMNPNFRFVGMELIPSYQVIFIADAMMKPGWDWMMLVRPMLIMSIEMLIFCFLALTVTRRHLLKEKR